MFPFPGIGVVFDIDQCGGNYGRTAWLLFMKHVDADRIAASILLEGDTAATLNGRAREFCIGVYGFDVAHIRQVFESVDDPGLAPMHRRFIEKIALDEQPLCQYGKIDAFGRLVTDAWTRSDHDRCKNSGWGYAPTQVPANLSPELQAELEELRSTPLEPRTKSGPSAKTTGPSVNPQETKPSVAGRTTPTAAWAKDESNVLRFACTKCGKPLKGDPANSGKKAKCPKCGAIVIVPSLDKLSGSAVAETKPASLSPTTPERHETNPPPRVASTPEPQPATVTCDRCKNAFPSREMIQLGQSKVCAACDRALDDEVINSFQHVTIIRSRRP